MCVYYCVKFSCDHEIWGQRLKPCSIGEDFEAGILPIDCNLKRSHGLKSRRVPRMCNKCVRTDANLQRMATKLQDCRQAFAKKWPEYDFDNIEESLRKHKPSDYQLKKLEVDMETCTSIMVQVADEIDAYERADSERRILQSARYKKEEADAGRDSGIGLEDDDTSDTASNPSIPSRPSSVGQSPTKRALPRPVSPRKAGRTALPVPSSYQSPAKLPPGPQSSQTLKSTPALRHFIVTPAVVCNPKLASPAKKASLTKPPVTQSASPARKTSPNKLASPAKKASPIKPPMTKPPVMPGAKNAPKLPMTPAKRKRVDSLAAKPAPKSAVKRTGQPCVTPAGRPLSRLQAPGFTQK